VNFIFIFNAMCHPTGTLLKPFGYNLGYYQNGFERGGGKHAEKLRVFGFYKAFTSKI